jgi:hypothetical protein
MGNLDKIPDGKLFADLQMSLTDIALMEMLTNNLFEQRLNREKNIASTIRAEIKQRFSEKQIVKFLNDGYPRQVNLTNKIISACDDVLNECRKKSLNHDTK